MLRKLGTFAALCLFSSMVLACGDDDDVGTIDCAWLQSENNCWAQALAEAESCLPPTDVEGVFDESLQVCSYETGHTVTFDVPVGFPPDSSIVFDGPITFEIESGGQACLTWRNSKKADSMTTASGTVKVETSGLATSISCPNGKKYEIANSFELLSCDNPPGRMVSGFHDIRFSALGGYGEGGFMNTTQLFSCQPADDL